MEDNNIKTEEEIKEEVKKEVLEEVKKEQLKNNENSTKKKGIGRIIIKIVSTIFVLLVLLNTIIGVIGMQNVNDGKEPIWYIDSKEEKSGNKTEKTYNLGLYVIVKTKEGNKLKTVLKPFFLK